MADMPMMPTRQLPAGSACTRFGVFCASVASAEDPAATIEPQRARLQEAKGDDRG